MTTFVIRIRKIVINKKPNWNLLEREGTVKLNDPYLFSAEWKSLPSMFPQLVLTSDH